jgi:hypothetical protein
MILSSHVTGWALILRLTGMLTEGQDTGGMSTTDVVYDDSDFEQVANIKDTAWHRDVDNEIFAADKAGKFIHLLSNALSKAHPFSSGYVRAYIILPSMVFALADTPFVKAGLQNPHSQQIPMLVKAALARGRTGMIGKGLARWPHVHIEDREHHFRFSPVSTCR